MSRIFVDHPDEWVGIPEDWAGTAWENGYQWASELVDVFAGEFTAPYDDQRATLRDVLVTVAGSRDPAITSRVYVSVDGWEGPLFVANLSLIPTADLPGVSAGQLAGGEDVDVVEKPLVTGFTTAEGLGGVKCVRYSQDLDAGGLIAKADYVVPTPDTFVRFSTAQYNLVAFERVQPRVERLAQSVRVAQ